MANGLLRNLGSRGFRSRGRRPCSRRVVAGKEVDKVAGKEVLAAVAVKLSRARLNRGRRVLLLRSI